MALTRVPYPSPNYSARNPAGVRLLVLHTAEGARTISSLGAYFADPAANVSSHAGIDDTPGTVGVFVRRQDCAWTQAGANSVAVSAELCAFAAWDRAEWDRHPVMLSNCAAWLAEEAAAFGLPLAALDAAAAQSAGRGVCQHLDLGPWGGGHVDCGPAFPLAEVLALAAGAGIPAEPELEEENMILYDPDSGGYWVLQPDGGILGYDGAPMLGNTYADPLASQHLPPIGLARFVDGSGEGYTIAHRISLADVRFYRYPRSNAGR